ncbi:MAG: hypothetical protein A3I75_00795 [Deltaproteobacteria bacterium RIFCSPLOWO2_02_FULL_50_16]|nr:MAG: hypothetical protein A2053_04605 [Deltaproteobacteria bacterium GWA2_50_8]OGQ30513.1 MAG: hypothetical protein A3B79_02535 [Deltaproteobacteria bacterium RIFCSPHIGHO2_02_FULL_50_15]OGQ56365.1 MAG: hypothetical protein A3I75_00795 [Deltaproteobacteria bacterium RIFCSPLOWO2_02_FULL_50_16]OGQ67768.1 MAG: hypothetical protein A3F89_02040 [Deltaproteobacteria bacterium RIFCSPLOWO2_12_FULL_50_11]
MPYLRKDRYFQKAKKEGWASRAAYKLIQINQKWSLLKKGMFVIDLGTSPGSWMQVIADTIGPQGRVIGIDLQPLNISLPPNALFLQGDLRDPKFLDQIEKIWPQKADLIVSDMAPKLTGVKFGDQFLSYELALLALKTCLRLLKIHGNFVVKVFPGQESEGLYKQMKVAFSKVATFSPEASRKTSSEVYWIGLGYKE